MRPNNMTNEELIAHVTNHNYDNTDRTTMIELVRELAGRLEDTLDAQPALECSYCKAPWEHEVHGGSEYNG